MALSVELLTEFVNGEQSLALLRKEAIYHLDHIDLINELISYEEFFRKYLIRNVPCVLTEWSTAKWRSRLEWCRDGRISWDVLEELFGDAVAPVANCNEQQAYSQAKINMKVKDFIDCMRKPNQESQIKDSSVLYLKDWHFTRDFPKYEAYETPLYFKSDWLNEFWESRTDACDDDDYRFIYIGPKGSWTPFHADVFSSYSWSANVCGRKKWILFAPGHEDGLRDRFGHLPFDLSHIESSNPDMYPHTDSCMKRFEVIQESGQIIFVPSGWHHQVYNLEDTISINHNWINGCNIDICWSYVEQKLREVEKEIAEHRHMEAWNKHCQMILRADCGMDFCDFFNLLVVVALNRLNLVDNCSSNSGRLKVEQQFNRLASSQEQLNHTHQVSGSRRNDFLVSPQRDLAIETGCSQQELVRTSDHQCTLAEPKYSNTSQTEINEKYPENIQFIGNLKSPVKAKLRSGDCKKYFDVMGVNNALYDLLRINLLLKESITSECLKNLDESSLVCLREELISKIEDTLDVHLDNKVSDKLT